MSLTEQYIILNIVVLRGVPSAFAASQSVLFLFFVGFFLALLWFWCMDKEKDLLFAFRGCDLSWEGLQ